MSNNDNILPFGGRKDGDQPKSEATDSPPLHTYEIIVRRDGEPQTYLADGFLVVTGSFVGVMQEDTHGFNFPQIVVPLGDLIVARLKTDEGFDGVIDNGEAPF